MNRELLHLPTVAVFGVGLIGGSLTLRLKQSGWAGHVIGVGRSMDNLEFALEKGAIDEISRNPIQAVERADIVVLATPVTVISGLIAEIAPAVDNQTIITDVGSVKNGIVEAAYHALGDKISRFVPGHPVAGREKSGIQAATDDLFENHKVILTPLPETDESAYENVVAMWQITGAEVKSMEVSHHDRVLSVTSHLPHVLAYVMMDFLANASDRESCYEMAAGGFYDFTRTASSDPEMWRDICIMNNQRLIQDIDKFKVQLEEVSAMIARGDARGLEDLFAAAKQARSLVTEKRKNPAAN